MCRVVYRSCTLEILKVEISRLTGVVKMAKSRGPTMDPAVSPKNSCRVRISKGNITGKTSGTRLEPT